MDVLRNVRENILAGEISCSFSMGRKDLERTGRKAQTSEEAVAILRKRVRAESWLGGRKDTGRYQSIDRSENNGARLFYYKNEPMNVDMYNGQPLSLGPLLAGTLSSTLFSSSLYRSVLLSETCRSKLCFHHVCPHTRLPGPLRILTVPSGHLKWKAALSSLPGQPVSAEQNIDTRQVIGGDDGGGRDVTARNLFRHPCQDAPRRFPHDL